MFYFLSASLTVESESFFAYLFWDLFVYHFKIFLAEAENAFKKNFFFLVRSVACGSSQVRNRTSATAAIQTALATMPSP